jgi:hypothetical protein
LRFSVDISAIPTLGISTNRLRYSALRRTDVRYSAEARSLADAISQSPEIAGGKDDILAEAVGVEAG